MVLWQFVVLVGLLIWIARLKSTGATGWEYSLVNLSGMEIESVENRLNELGRWGSELVLIWSPLGTIDEKLPGVALSALSESDAAVVENVMREAAALGLRLPGDRPKQETYAIFKKRIPIGRPDRDRSAR